MYIVMELQKNENSGVSNIVTEHATLPEAESKYYTVLASAAVSKLPVHSAVLVSEEGFPIKNQCYKHG